MIDTKIADSKLKNGLEAYRSFCNNVPLARISFDINGKVIKVNNLWCELAGYNEQEVLNNQIADYIRPDSVDWFNEVFLKCRSTENNQIIEISIIKKGGSDIAVSCLLQAGKSDKDTESHIQCIMFDVSPDNGSIESHQKSGKFAEDFLNVAVDIILSLDKHCLITSLNDNGHKLLGYKPQELIGKNWFETCLPQGEREEVKALFDRLMRGELKAAKFYENTIITKSGEERTILWRNTVVRDEPGNVMGTISSGEDITDRKKAADNLKKSEAYLRAVIDTIPDLIWMKDPDGVYQMCNRKFERFFGAREMDIINKSDYDFFRKDEADFFRNKDLLAVESGKPTVNEETITYSDDGHKEIVETIKTPMFAPDGSLIGVLGIARDITKRIECAFELKDNENKYRTLYESSIDAVLLSDDNSIIDCNNASLELFGYSDKREILGKHIADLSPVDQPCGRNSRKLANEYMQQVVEDGNLHIEWLHLKSDGTTFPGEIMMNVMSLDGENILQTVIRDISQRKRLEAIYIRQEKEVRDIINAIQVGVVLIDADNRKIVNCNRAALQMMKAAKSDVIGNACHKYICHKSPKTCCLDEGNCDAELVEAILTTTDNKQLPILKSVSQINLSGDDYVLVTFVDISNKKQIENELRKLSTAIEQSSNVVIITDTEGNIEYVNPKFTESTGYTAKEAIGQNPRILRTDDTPDHIYEDLWKTISNRKTWRGELLNKKKSGEQYWEKAIIYPVIDEKGNIVNYIAIKHDITKQKEMENERKDMELEMNQARKLEAVGSLASGIAHEINTPIQFVGDNVNFMMDSFNDVISLIKTYDELWSRVQAEENIEQLDKLLRDAKENVDFEYIQTEIPDAIDQTLDGVKRVAKIVRAMKDFAHSDQGKKSNADINDMLMSCLTVSRNELKYVANIETELDPDLPAVECYRDDLNQVFLNLLINAAHAIEDVVGDGSVGKGTITVSTHHKNNKVIIKIADTGSGIPKKIRSRIFDPFFTTKDVGKGSGQGLAITHKIIVEKHKGNLDFETELKKGTTFIIELPMSVSDIAESS